MKKYSFKDSILNSLFAFASVILLLGLASCAEEEFNWKGREVGSDEYLIAFANSSPVIETVTGTRAADAERNKVKEVSLVIFSGNNLPQALYFTVAGGTISSDTDGIGGSVTVKKRDVADGDWYLIANANAKVGAYMTNHQGTSFTPSEMLGALECDEKQLEEDGEEAFILTANKSVSVEDAQTEAPVFMLDHIFSRLTVAMNATDGKFLMTGVKFDKFAKTGTLSSSKNNALVAYSGWVESPRTGDWNGEISYAKAGEEMTLASYPYKAASKKTEDNMFVLVKGHYNKATQTDIDGGTTRVFDKDDVCYYAVPVPTLEANHKYCMSITSAPVPGQPTEALAIANPGGLSIRFVDETERIRNIISDGKNVLAVCDTVRIASKPLSGSDPVAWTLPVKARHADTEAPAVTLEHISGGEGWLTIPEESFSTEPISNDQETSNGLFSSKIEISGTAAVNNGSEREAVYKVKLDGTDLEREVVFLQAANENIKYSDLFTITLKIERGTEAITFAYLPFINPDITSETATATLVGAAPAQNGGRIRNLGLHAPMPNGGNVKYTYTITLKQSAATVTEKGVSGTKSGSTITYSFTDSADGYAYKVMPDAITIAYGGTTYTLDLYHTGFFYQHQANGPYHYYEVFSQNNNLHWLDRNLEAKSAGMGVRNSAGSVLQSAEWPIVGAAAMGGLYNMSEAAAAKIPGWNIPSYAQMRSLTTLAGFTTERMATYPAMTGFYAPSYLFNGTEGSRDISIRSYFPQNMMQTGDATSGDRASGYYMTSTSAGTQNWYQIMQFSGMNVSSQNKDLSANKVSLRLCAGTYNPTVQDTKYTCSVQGYTHVFLYYLNTDGSKTFLTTWPGEQVAVVSDIDRYHPFELTPA
ncbi:MAG: hypothetical protein K2H76_10065, partial [Muribaculaceae bacterium]|nr:hypothetical protein [Muribaculaceae bacterium]